jgi:hypothetical protein
MNREQQGRVPGALAERLYVSIERFRKNWDRYRRPEDLRQLIRVFPSITLAEGVFLDYLPMGGQREHWIWPFVLPQVPEPEIPEVLASIPRDQLVRMRGSSQARHIEIQTLYRYLKYPKTSLGLFEYAVFVMELWATKSASKAQQWLDIRPLFSRHAFENQLRKHGGSVKKISRPEVFDPIAILGTAGGGEVNFLAYQGGAWKRIFKTLLHIDHHGHVRSEAGKVFVNFE